MSLQLAALALLDSLNILTLAIAAFLLGTPRPIARTLAYVAGTAAGYFVAGAMLLLGWQVLLEQLLPRLNVGLVGTLQVIVGMALVLLSLRSIRRPPRQYTFRPPQRIRPVATFTLGAVIGLLYAPTDPRHNMAIGIIVANAQGYSEQLLWLIWYNCFYILALLAMVLLRVAWPERSDVVFGWLLQALGNFFHRALPWLILICGLVLMLDGMRRMAV